MNTPNLAPQANVDQLIIEDLAKSGLQQIDVRSRAITDTERAASSVPTGINGYAIPYFDLFGKPVPFYRVRLFNFNPKYKQVKNTANHIYFPRNFKKNFDRPVELQNPLSNVVFIVEGEKKACLLDKLEYAAIAVSGVDSWRNRSLILPKETEFVKFKYTEEVIKANIPSGMEALDYNLSSYATGFEDFIELSINRGKVLVIVYDTDKEFGVKPEVQRAAATLGYELRNRGFKMPQIKQLILPQVSGLAKVGLDDFIQHPTGGAEKFKKLAIHTVNNPRSFPVHPNIQDFIAKKLQRSKISRKDMQGIAMALIAEMDTKGYRMHCVGEQQMYYFDHASARLMKVPLNSMNGAAVQETTFGKILYQEYGISPSADNRLIQWLGTLFPGEDPVMDVNPHRVIARPDYGDDCTRFQISDGKYVNISADGIKIVDNGSDGVLFEAGRVIPTNVDKLNQEIARQKASIEANHGSIPMWWNDILQESRLKERGNRQLLTALLYYISPWLYRWKGTQLPVEIIIGEPGSGKSTLQELRLAIQTGIADLKNAPGDIRDWHAALSNSGGLHVTDNVQLINKGLRTMLSDEICRLITEPEPHVEMRTLYTDADLTKIKVDNVFVFTAVAQPFFASDLLQRSFVVEFDKGQGATVNYDSTWKDRKLNQYGGREAWLAHHLIVLEAFFKAVRSYWNPKYQAKYRLVNLEQILMIMAKNVFRLDDASWIPDMIANDVTSHVAANDLALSGLIEFARVHMSKAKSKKFTSAEIVEWALSQADYEDCTLLKNGRKLGIYMSANKHMVFQVSGLKEEGKINNRVCYSINPPSVPTA